MTTSRSAQARPTADTVALLGAGSDAGRLLPGVARQMGFPVRSFLALGQADDAPEDDPEAEFEIESATLEGFDFTRVPMVLDLGATPHPARAAALAAGTRVIGRRPWPDPPLPSGTAPRARKRPTSRLALAELELYPEGPHWHVPPPFAALAAPLLRALAGRGRLARLALTALYPASAYGSAGVEELAAQTAALLNAREPPPGVLPGRLAFNALPQARTRDDTELAEALIELLPGIVEPASLLVTGAVVPLFHGHLLSLAAWPEGPGDDEPLATRLRAATGTLRSGGFRLLEGLSEAPSGVRRRAGQASLFSVADGVLDDLRPVFGGRRPGLTMAATSAGIVGWLAADGLTAGVVAPMLRLARRVLDGL